MQLGCKKPNPGQLPGCFKQVTTRLTQHERKKLIVSEKGKER